MSSIKAWAAPRPDANPGPFTYEAVQKILLAAILLAFFQARAQTTDPRLVTGSVDTVYSAILKEKRTIWVSLPASARDKQLYPQRYPVVYLLDGNNHFATVTAMINQLTPENGNFILPEMIVVGILNTNRARDFTPWPSDWWVFGPPSPLEHTGGGEDFDRFLEKELIPYIDSLYPTAPFRVLIGHSLGGLAAANVLINHTSLFNGYILVDPSMWYDNGRFLQRVNEAMHKKRFDNTTLFLGIAHSMGPGLDIRTVRRDTAAGSIHTRNILHFVDIIRANASQIKGRMSKGNGLRFDYRYYPDDSHMSAPLVTEYDGLRSLFDFYPLPPDEDVAMHDPWRPSDPAPIFRQHFIQISKYMGYTVTPPEDLLNLYAQSFLDYNLPQRAFQLYSLNLLNYPKSPGAWKRLGDYFLSTGDTVQANSYYQHIQK
jgi:uncharacterized protein